MPSAGAQPATVLPRVLVMVSLPEELACAAEGLRGVAEFLPLEDPVEAIEIIARFQPDIVYLSVRNEQYSGLEIAKMLRENPRLSTTELVFIVGGMMTPPEFNAARRLTQNEILPIPLTAQMIRKAFDAIARRPGFSPREKSLGYGVYVKEVIRRADEDRHLRNRAIEREMIMRRSVNLVSFMANELKDYKDAPIPRQ